MGSSKKPRPLPEFERDKTRVEHRSNKADWGTPEHVLEAIRSIDSIGLDPATSEDNPTKAEHFYTVTDDGLKLSWVGKGLVYCNCPYGRKRNFRCREWVEKAVKEASQGAEIVLLLPARTDTEWFHMLFENATAICFVRRRLVFVGADAGAPFPSVLAYFGNRPRVFSVAFKGFGYIHAF